MVKEIRIPKVGMSTVEVEISEVMIDVGDRVSEGQVIMCLAADKVDIDLQSDFAGEIEEILVEEGQEVNVGDIVARIRTEGD